MSIDRLTVIESKNLKHALSKSGTDTTISADRFKGFGMSLLQNLAMFMNHRFNTRLFLLKIQILT